MKRVDGKLPSDLRLEACGDDPRVLAALMATLEGTQTVDEAAGLVPLPSERRLAVCWDDPRILAALMATPEGTRAVDRTAGLAK